MARKLTEKTPTSMDVLRKESKARKDKESYDLKIMAFKAAVMVVRNAFSRMETAAEVVKACIRLEI